MKYKKVISLIMCVMLSTPLCVSADELSSTPSVVSENSEGSTDSSNSGFSSSKDTDINAAMCEVLANCNQNGSIKDDETICNDIYDEMETTGTFSMSNLIESACGITLPEGKIADLAIDRYGESFDTAFINLQYTSTETNLLMNALGNIETQENATQNVTSVFQNAFGDLTSEVGLKEYTLPDGYDSNTLISQMSNAVNSAYSSAINSDAFKSVKDSISIGDIFAKAAEGPTTYSLASESTLSSLVSGLSASQKAKTNSVYNNYLKEDEAKKNSQQNIQDKATLTLYKTALYKNSMINLDGSLNYSNSRDVQKSINDKTSRSYINNTNRSVSNYAQKDILAYAQSYAKQIQAIGENGEAPNAFMNGLAKWGGLLASTVLGGWTALTEEQADNMAGVDTMHAADAINDAVNLVGGIFHGE